MKTIRAIVTTIWADRLKAIARRVEANVPNQRDPEAFHAEKSEIAADIRNIARSLE